MSRWLVVVLSVCLVSSSWADQPKQKKKRAEKAKAKAAAKAEKVSPPVDRSKEATTEIAQADGDFGLQGEYMGTPAGGDLIGLQVVALGDGRFDGVLQLGGLPGAGWDRRTKVSLTGERQSTSSAVLLSDRFEIFVSGETARIKHRYGGDLGSLRKWHRISPTLDAPPPPGAIVLFDGSNPSQLQGATLTADRLLEVGAITKMPVGDFQMHLEFRTPYMPYARGQGRGNSGIYIQQRYEVQVLDSFGLSGADNECGGLYKQRPPAVNMCLPPLSWQTYDIDFTTARWNSQGEKVSPARITVLHNGEPVHANYALTAKTGGGKQEGPELFPILLQNHGNPVNYRNIWIVPRNRATCQPPSWETRSACDTFFEPSMPIQFGNECPPFFRAW